MRLPDFLIIGAMKAGTTSLFRDLMTNPEVYFPVDKEPACLGSDFVRSPSGLQEYASLFRAAKSGQICGEASTDYTKIPDVPRVPRRVRAVLGNNVKTIYLAREPVSRAISQHYHDYGYGLASADADHELCDRPRYVNYSRYSMQLEPWLDELDHSRVRVVRFEDYIANRRATVAELSRYLGITPRPELIDDSQVFNRSEERPQHTGFGHWARNFPLYRGLVRPVLSTRWRDALRTRFLPRAPSRPSISFSTVQLLAERLVGDVERLSTLLGQTSPWWDLQKVVTRYAKLEACGQGR